MAATCNGCTFLDYIPNYIPKRYFGKDVRKEEGECITLFQKELCSTVVQHGH
jgi:hypothetical protein